MVTKKTTINQLKTMFDNLESKFEKEILILKQESINMSKRINTLENKFGSNDVLDVKCETNEISNDKSYIKEIEIGPSEKIKGIKKTSF